MISLKLAAVGVCLGLLGIAMHPDASPVAVGCAFLGVVIATVGCFLKDKQS